MAVLILGSLEDEHASYMLEYLTARGADVHVVDSRWFPHALGLSFDPVTGGGRIVLPDGKRLEFADIRSVYWRNYLGVPGVELPSAEQTYIAQNDARSLFESFLICLDATWVNGWNAFWLHQ